MTRINTIEPEELSRQHLLAEYRELPRIFGLVKAAISRGETPDDRRNPLAYTLGTGHCRFFYPRLGYLAKRQIALIREMKKRSFKVAYDEDTVLELLEEISGEWLGDWFPDDDAVAINRERIALRNQESAKRA